MSGSEIQALFIDLDGTLADSMGTMSRVFERFLQIKKIDAKPSEFRGMSHKPLDAMIQIFRERYGIDYSEMQLINEFYDLADEVYAEETVPMPGARRLLEEAHRRGVGVHVVTSARGTVTRDFLQHNHMAGFVSGIVAAEDVTIHKPDPQPYQIALQRAALPVKRCLAVEDSVVGSLSATRAGLATWIMNPRGISEVDPSLPGVRGFVRRLDQLIEFL